MLPSLQSRVCLMRNICWKPSAWHMSNRRWYFDLFLNDNKFIKNLPGTIWYQAVFWVMINSIMSIWSWTYLSPQIFLTWFSENFQNPFFKLFKMYCISFSYNLVFIVLPVHLQTSLLAPYVKSTFLYVPRMSDIM
jgi:hypothetical protein